MAQEQKDNILKAIVKRFGRKFAIELKNRYFNEKLANMLVENNDLVKILVVNARIISKFQPVYCTSVSKLGNAQFYASTKRIGKWNMETLWFNILIIWTMTLSMYLFLKYNIGLKILRFLNKFQPLKFIT